jgi:hypothetical protein
LPNTGTIQGTPVENTSGKPAPQKQSVVFSTVLGVRIEFSTGWRSSLAEYNRIFVETPGGQG